MCYFGIGIENPKNKDNVGTLWRSAYSLGASFIFTIGDRIRKQCSDTLKSHRHIPYTRYRTFESFYSSMPYDCILVGVENDENALPIYNYTHPKRCVYLLGAEDHGLSKLAMQKVNHTVILPGKFCLNVSVAGSLIMYDRLGKRQRERS